MVRYRIVKSPLGEIIWGGKGEKICFCHFALPSLEAAKRRIATLFPKEQLEPAQGDKEYSFDDLLKGRHSVFRWEDFHLEGTTLQKAVWRELFNLPPDEIISYSVLAARCGYPKAVRAVATAVGKNPISLIIPCHRVVRSEALCSGGNRNEKGANHRIVVNGQRYDGPVDRRLLGNYEWGKELKVKILEWEGLI